MTACSREWSTFQYLKRFICFVANERFWPDEQLKKKYFYRFSIFYDPIVIKIIKKIPQKNGRKREEFKNKFKTDLSVTNAFFRPQICILK